ncbi:hypothetical protein [Mesorhizobium sp. B2-6-1]|uniref:hypothetical protein n=1 Tax=Mesorhizobium sp. B2-6-1 TaxID=2589916 RepID=UPI00112ED817|nr:hypothetical protein [Mesorhizobium sp. B2-6-1]TPJ59967.1 hypothetical protein FJ443_22505 [Mesorhizobium sp. B2-6-1]
MDDKTGEADKDEALDLDSADPAEIEAIADQAITTFNETIDRDTAELIVAKFTLDGTLDPNVIGVDQQTLDATVKAFENRMTSECLAPVGLTLSDYLDCCDEADLPAIRSLVVKGDWKAIAEHAQRIRTALNQGDE